MPYTTPTTVIGEFERPEAFSAARALEHAGIATEVRGHDASYTVSVALEQVERALAIV
jgi:hypothetical protein